MSSGVIMHYITYFTSNHLLKSVPQRLGYMSPIQSLEELQEKNSLDLSCLILRQEKCWLTCPTPDMSAWKFFPRNTSTMPYM